SADTLRGIANHWTEVALHVSNYVAPTSQVRVRFVAADFGGASTVEGAVDDIVTYDGNTPAVTIPDRPHPARLALSAVRPNPTRGGMNLTIGLPRTGDVEVVVLDLTGRRVATLLHGAVSAGVLPIAWDGRDASGRMTPAGLYFV